MRLGITSQGRDGVVEVERRLASGPRLSPVVSVASGKGGVGKTTIVANLAVSLARCGRKVLAVDADFGLSNLDVVLGLSPRDHIGHFLSGQKKLEEVVLSGPAGILIVPGASGLPGLTALSGRERQRLLEGLSLLRCGVDLLLIDTAAGIGENVTGLLAASSRSIVVTDPEPTSLVDAYALIKVMEQIRPGLRLSIVVNSVEDGVEARGIAEQLQRVVRRFLGRSIDLLGWIARDPVVSKAVRNQKLVVTEYPESQAACCFRRLAENVCRHSDLSGQGTVLDFPRARARKTR